MDALLKSPTQAEVEALLLSAKVAGVAVLVALPIALVIGILLARFRFRGHFLINLITLLPLVLPPVVTGYVLLIAFGNQGWIGKFLKDQFDFSFAFQWTGAALAAGVMAFPLMVRPIRQAAEAIDNRLPETAKTLGAGNITIFFTLILPLTLPGVLAALTLGFAKALGEFGATITFVSNIPGETRTLPLSIYTFLQSPDGDAALWRLTALSILLAVLAVIASEYFSRRFVKSHPRSGGGNA